MIRRLVAVACDKCDAICPDSASPTYREAKQIADAAGWRKPRGKRICPACTTTPTTAGARP